MKDRVIPQDVAYNESSFDILIEGKVVDPGYQVLSITTHKAINRVSTAKVVIRDGDAAKETFDISEKEEFIPGKKIVIKLGKDSKNQQQFKGIIVKHGLKVKEDGSSILILDCRDECYKMTLGRRNFYYENSKDSEVIEEIIGRYKGLSKDVEPTSLKHAELVQHHCSDWDFILSRAEVNGLYVVADDGKLIIKPPKTKEDPAIKVLYGSTLIDFEAEMDVRGQWSEVTATSWDYKNQDVVDSSVTTADVKEPGNVEGKKLAADNDLKKYELRHSGQVLEQELQAWSKAIMQRSRLSKIQGRAKFIGFGKLKPGDVIELQGVGARFNGRAFVSEVLHELVDGAWFTQVQFGLPKDCYHHTADQIFEAPAAGVVPPIHGLQIGKVVQLQEDPDGEDRILVRLPIIDAKARGVWARVAALDAGKERGSFFRPEIEDEVVVGFLNDDPRDPIVLGMLNSSALPAPIADVKDTNHEKGFFTRSKMRLHFHDETKTITIDTPAGNSIMLDEDGKTIVIEDQNKNKMVMDKDGIVIKSAKDIKMTAPGKIEIEATQDLNLKGLKIAAEAKTSMEAKGATAKLQGQGITEIVGSLIKIN